MFVFISREAAFLLVGLVKVLCCSLAFADVFGSCLSEDEGKCLLLSVGTSLGFLSFSSRKMLDSYRCSSAFSSSVWISQKLWSISWCARDLHLSSRIQLLRASLRVVLKWSAHLNSHMKNVNEQSVLIR